MADKNLHWFRVDADIFNSEEMVELFELQVRDQHKIFFLDCVIKAYITKQIGNNIINNESTFDLNMSMLVRLSHLKSSNILTMIEQLSIFGVELVSSCNKVVTIRYVKFMKSFNLPIQRQSKSIEIDSDKETQLYTEKDLETQINSKTHSQKEYSLNSTHKSVVNSSLGNSDQIASQSSLHDAMSIKEYISYLEEMNLVNWEKGYAKYKLTKKVLLERHRDFYYDTGTDKFNCRKGGNELARQVVNDIFYMFDDIDPDNLKKDIASLKSLAVNKLKENPNEDIGIFFIVNMLNCSRNRTTNNAN